MTKLERLQQEKEIIIQQVCLSNYANSDKSYKLIASDLSKQKPLDAGPGAIQQIVSIGEVKIKSVIYYILEQSKETVLEFYKETTKIL